MEVEGEASAAQAGLARRLRRQGAACAQLGSPLYTDLLERLAADVENGGASWAVLEGRENDPPGSALALRLMGAVRRLALEGRAPELEAHYRSAASGAAWEIEPVWRAFDQVLNDSGPEIRRRLNCPVQTNEVGRAAALLGGFSLVGERTGLPLRLLELGASAGLNLLFDRFAYESSDGVLGPISSPARVQAEFSGEARPPFGRWPEVVDRRGCDLRPLDPASKEGRLTLLAYLWPDQAERLRQLEGALAVAREVPVQVDKGRAEEWLGPMLAAEPPGLATVVFHSIFTQYLAPAGREELDQRFHEAGARASATAPLARLEMEAAGEAAAIHLTLWPGGERCLIARAGYHGRPVVWVSGRSSTPSPPCLPPRRSGQARPLDGRKASPHRRLA